MASGHPALGEPPLKFKYLERTAHGPPFAPMPLAKPPADLPPGSTRWDTGGDISAATMPTVRDLQCPIWR
jgi:hypothetical protein